MSEDKRKYEKSSQQQKLRYMRALEANGLNQALTARELGISRSTMARYYKKYWKEYKDNKAAVFAESTDIGRKKLLLDADLENISVKLRGTFLKSLNLLEQRLKNDPASIKTKDLIQFLSVAAPYLMEKMAVAGAKDTKDDMSNSVMATHSTFVQNIVNQINNAKKDKDQHNSSFNSST
ncbi:helix-turn-helix domain-containing protein [Draconibacterium sediminis]|uniref:DNA binding HTH domain-containing protein n=1 Tax=Draconibacterium sediminis TaxID=1544798 RepID=A0A0D8JF73_9BACT|nr:helix-turn-helix domain-containing protein [Draconibacterium sediminis]KJF45364.1 hypothetical protein LH29_08315 [Draconibacterium sediminis]